VNATEQRHGTSLSEQISTVEFEQRTSLLNEVLAFAAILRERPACLGKDDEHYDKTYHHHDGEEGERLCSRARGNSRCTQARLEMMKSKTGKREFVNSVQTYTDKYKRIIG
jgi:hypothetical protein